MPIRSAHPGVPPFLALAGHPLRWRLLRELADGDRQVGELTRIVDEPQALVSYHLGRLRAGGLVSSHRSAADARATYYRVHLDRCGDLLASAGQALHPALGVQGGEPRITGAVLFACTGNGTRSQIAEALLRDAAASADAVLHVASAGSHPKPIHANAVRVLAERGIDISSADSKSLTLYEGRHFDYVITLCDKVREVCPEFPGQVRALHWSIEDPSGVPGTDRQTLPAFRAVADDLHTRIHFLMATIEHEENSLS